MEKLKNDNFSFVFPFEKSNSKVGKEDANFFKKDFDFWNLQPKWIQDLCETKPLDNLLIFCTTLTNIFAFEVKDMMGFKVLIQMPRGLK